MYLVSINIYGIYIVCTCRPIDRQPHSGMMLGVGRPTHTHKGLVSDNPHRSEPLGSIRMVAPLETDLSRSKCNVFAHSQPHARARTHTYTRTRTHADVHTHAYTHMHMHVAIHHTHTCTHAHTHTHTHRHRHTHAHTPLHTWSDFSSKMCMEFGYDGAHTYTYTYTYTCTYQYPYPCTCTYTYTYPCTYIHTHMQRFLVDLVVAKSAWNLGTMVWTKYATNIAGNHPGRIPRPQSRQDAPAFFV